MLSENLRMSLSNIFHNKMRSFLTILGIVIGVMAIITLITVVQSATREVTSQFEALGTGTLNVQAPGTPLKGGLSAQDLADVLAINGVSGISPSLSQVVSAVYAGRVEEDVTVEGQSATYFRRQSETVSRGRPLLPIDETSRSRVCVINEALARALWSGTDPLGREVLLGGRRYLVVGILEEGSSKDVMSQLSGGSDDGKALLPYTTAMRDFGVDKLTNLRVYVGDTDDTDAVSDALEAVLERAFNYKDDSYTIINMESLLDTMNTMLSMMTSLLAGIASIALLVGGIGIMNMMLVSVTERTSEIGLRKALGAKPSGIQTQFLMESFLLSMIGGVMGVLLGIGVSYLFSVLMDIGFSLSLGAVGLAFGFSAAVGVLFGWAPARKASRLNPIDALRSL